MTEQPVITKGWFDSHNLAFWDVLRGEYREYHREYHRQFRDYPNGRDIMTGTSKDFLNWTDPVWLGYSPGRTSELYTNGVIPYYRSPHIFLGFPTRYEDRGWTSSAEELPQLDYRRVRSSGSMREGTAVTDGMFMSSRDALNFDIWPESFIRPGLRARDGWFYGDNYQNWGIVETESAIQGAQRELSFYVTEAAHQPDTPKRLRRHFRCASTASCPSTPSWWEERCSPSRWYMPVASLCSTSPHRLLAVSGSSCRTRVGSR